MKFLSFKNQLLGTLIEDIVVDMNSAYQAFNVKRLPLTMLDLVKSDYDRVCKVWDLAHKAKDSNQCCYNIKDVEVQPPFPELQRNIFCLGRNYIDHVKEMGHSTSDNLPEDIIVFTKSAGSVIGHNNNIPSHSFLTNSLDYEAEVALIIGKGLSLFRAFSRFSFLYCSFFILTTFILRIILS